MWDLPFTAPALRRVGEFARVIAFDKRGFAVTCTPVAGVAVPAHATVGNYTLKVHWTNPVIKDTLSITLNAHIRPFKR
jgi:hypothetical protein